MALNPDKRLLLIIPDGSINHRMGGGQRSAILFSALKSLGPVDVVVLGEGTGTGPQEFFPGAASFQWAPSSRFSVIKKKGLSHLIYNLRRFLFVPALYAPQASVTEALDKLVTPAHRLIACRYALTYCATGLTKTPGRDVFVDIDDRDDQTFQSTATAVLGTGVLGCIFRKYVVPSVLRQLYRRLPGTSFLWYAKAEDDLNLPGVGSAVLRNVPFNTDIPAGAPPPSARQDVVFVGSHAHRPNQDGVRWFLRECWPTLHARHPEARFRIVGLGAWQQLQAEFPDTPGVEYVGTIDDIATAYFDARLVVSPLFEGGGSKIKVIEACAFGRPIVVSRHSAQGFGDAIAAALPQSDDAAGFIDLCTQYLADPDAADRLGQHLQDLQRAHFSRAAAEAQIAADIRSVIGS
ncbi:hypothetical protein ROLI_045340 (plasmid) [Roseobacter fucihabitans]|uniref:Uncharacterized protein n=1 Tax=Roseobacter fucihabitans TaxID=1537242 RepID=A0ABZ2C2C3_9RHOB|nr:glycosyltransferase family 4 protein [Roseobacter litoralis]MBC6967249.1 Glycosyl transferases group 1 [Roseobacter litoralis]